MRQVHFLARFTAEPVTPARLTRYTGSMPTIAEFERIRWREHLLSRSNLNRISLLVFTLFYFADVCLRASSKYFWYDEILTLYFSRLPDLHALWGALHSGIESNPPAFHLLTRATEAIFGEGLIATRLPEIVGFWVMCLCLFTFVERRAGLIAGLTAMTLPMLTGAYYYAYEARPPILIAALASLALICWDNARSSPQRNRWMLGFGFALFAALMLHCYAILLTIPFGLSELTRDIRNRRINWPFWVALTLPLLPAIALYVPLTHAFGAISKGTHFGSFEPVWPQILKSYVFLVQPCSAILLGALVLFAFDRSNQPPHSTLEEGNTRFTWQDGLLLLAFLTFPVFGVLLGKILHTPYSTRYFLSALLGISIPFAVLAGVRPHRRWIARLVLSLIVLALALNFIRLVKHQLAGSGELVAEPSTQTRLNTVPGQPLYLHPLIVGISGDHSTPIFVLSSLDFLYLLQYAPDLAPRLYFVQYAQDMNLRELHEFLPWSPVKYNQTRIGLDLLQSHATLYIYGDPGHLEEFYRLARSASIKYFRAEEGHFLATMQAVPPY